MRALNLAMKKYAFHSLYGSHFQLFVSVKKGCEKGQKNAQFLHVPFSPLKENRKLKTELPIMQPFISYNLTTAS